MLLVFESNLSHEHSATLPVYHCYNSKLVFCYSYKHAIDGMARVVKEEGFAKLFSGVDWATGRAVRTKKS